MSKDDVIKAVNDVLDVLTWKRAGLLCLLATCAMTLLVGFENRATLFNKIISDVPIETRTAPWEVSDATKEVFVKLINSSPLIGGALVMEVDLKKNRRIVKFWSVKDAAFRMEAAKVVSSILPQAFFNEDRKNNDQMLMILDNKFACVKVEDSIYIRFFPTMAKTLPYLCRLAVPPFAGQFAGFATVFLTRQPTASDVDSLKIELTRISIEMYLKDIDRSTRN